MRKNYDKIDYDFKSSENKNEYYGLSTHNHHVHHQHAANLSVHIDMISEPQQQLEINQELISSLEEEILLVTRNEDAVYSYYFMDDDNKVSSLIYFVRIIVLFLIYPYYFIR